MQYPIFSVKLGKEKAWYVYYCLGLKNSNIEMKSLILSPKLFHASQSRFTKYSCIVPFIIILPTNLERGGLPAGTLRRSRAVIDWRSPFPFGIFFPGISGEPFSRLRLPAVVEIRSRCQMKAENRYSEWKLLEITIRVEGYRLWT